MEKDELSNYHENIDNNIKINKLSRYERGLYLLFFILIIILSVKIFFLNSSFNEVHKYDYSKLDSIYLEKFDNKNSKNISNNFLKTRYKKNRNEDIISTKKIDKKTKEINKINSLTVSKKVININTSNIDELITLKGIGRATAKKIILLREKKGNFKSLEDLLEVKGIGKKKLKKIYKFIKL